MFEFLRCLCVGGFGGNSECPFVIEDLRPRPDRRPAIVLPNRGDVESQFLCRCVEPRSWKGVWEVPDFSGCSFEDGVHLRHCRRGECHEAMCLVYFLVCSVYEEALFNIRRERCAIDRFAYGFEMMFCPLEMGIRA